MSSSAAHIAIRCCDMVSWFQSLHGVSDQAKNFARQNPASVVLGILLQVWIPEKQTVLYVWQYSSEY